MVVIRLPRPLKMFCFVDVSVRGGLVLVIVSVFLNMSFIESEGKYVKYDLGIFF